MATLQTDNPRIRTIVDELVADVTAACGPRLRGIYIMGSLARGCFSEATSDIDIGVLTATHDADDTSRFATITAAHQPGIENRISIFWGDDASVCGETATGRFPPFDRLDLLDHGVLLAGRDTRSERMRPGYAELMKASVEFALDYLATPTRIKALVNCRLLAATDRVTLTKTVLFPARFIYLADTGAIAGNDVAAAHYTKRFSGPDATLVAAAFRWRTESVPSEPVVFELLEEGLLPLYRRFMETYRPHLLATDEHSLIEQLDVWLSALDRPDARDVT